MIVLLGLCFWTHPVIDHNLILFADSHNNAVWPSQQSVPLGSAVIIHCQGSPYSAIMWLHNGVPIVADNNTVVEKNYIIIISVIRSYSGEYSCYTIKELFFADLGHSLVHLNSGNKNAFANLVGYIQ